jgi:hypothetical protein
MHNTLRSVLIFLQDLYPRCHSATQFHLCVVAFTEPSLKLYCTVAAAQPDNAPSRAPTTAAAAAVVTAAAATATTASA